MLNASSLNLSWIFPTLSPAQGWCPSPTLTPPLLRTVLISSEVKGRQRSCWGASVNQGVLGIPPWGVERWKPFWHICIMVPFFIFPVVLLNCQRSRIRSQLRVKCFDSKRLKAGSKAQQRRWGKPPRLIMLIVLYFMRNRSPVEQNVNENGSQVVFRAFVSS